MDDEFEYRNEWDDEERNAPGMFPTMYRPRPRKRAVGQTTVAPWRPLPPPQVVVAAPPPPPAPRSLLGDISLGTLVQLGAMGYAALAPLPPKPAVMGDPRTDQQNLLTYQEALAQHAKRAQQISTLGLIGGALLQGRRL
ncbi:MAG: hypothetical protein IT370_21015 [Deltaproteobacteria bacterium]|nr:hypothetical protein [Deltaproteobacteria bacterium]